MNFTTCVPVNVDVSMENGDKREGEKKNRNNIQKMNQTFSHIQKHVKASHLNQNFSLFKINFNEKLNKLFHMYKTIRFNSMMIKFPLKKLMIYFLLIIIILLLLS